jgi:ATP-binding cassette subfamily B protein
MQTRISISALYGTLAESISGVRAIQSMSREGENSRRFDKLNDENRVTNNWAAFLSSAVMPVIELAVAVSTAGILIVGGLRAIHASSVDVAALFGVITSFTVYVTRFFDPIRDLVMQYTMFQRAMAGGERIFEVLDTPPRVVDKPDAVEQHVFMRGNPGSPGPVAPRQFFECLTKGERKPFAHGSGRRPR